ncbi:YwaF family protein [Lutibacter sp.]
MTDSIFLKDNQDFILFGNQHLIALLFFITFGYVLIKWAKKLTIEKQYIVGNIFAFSLSITVIIWTFLKIYTRGFDIKEDLPFHLCNFVALLLPVFTLTKKKIYFDIILFWILAGTSHSIITPDLRNGFPNFIFLKYWYVHAGLIIFVFYAAIVLNLRPNLKSVFYSFLALQLYAGILFIINKNINSNYFYTNSKPHGPTALNYLGEWPYYILTIELLLIPYFLIIYLPFYLTRKKN